MDRFHHQQQIVLFGLGGQLLQPVSKEPPGVVMSVAAPRTAPCHQASGTHCGGKFQGRLSVGHRVAEPAAVAAGKSPNPGDAQHLAIVLGQQFLELGRFQVGHLGSQQAQRRHVSLRPGSQVLFERPVGGQSLVDRKWFHRSIPVHSLPRMPIAARPEPWERSVRVPSFVMGRNGITGEAKERPTCCPAKAQAHR